MPSRHHGAKGPASSDHDDEEAGSARVCAEDRFPVRFRVAPVPTKGPAVVCVELVGGGPDQRREIANREDRERFLRGSRRSPLKGDGDGAASDVG